MQEEFEKDEWIITHASCCEMIQKIRYFHNASVNTIEQFNELIKTKVID